MHSLSERRAQSGDCGDSMICRTRCIGMSCGLSGQPVPAEVLAEHSNLRDYAEKMASGKAPASLATPASETVLNQEQSPHPQEPVIETAIHDPRLGYNLTKGTMVGGAKEIAEIYDAIQANELPANVKRAIRYQWVDDVEAERLKQATGLSLNGYKHTVDSFAMRHAQVKHGNSREVLRGQEPITGDDWARIPEIVRVPDHVESAGKDALGNDLIRYQKRFNGTTYYVEEVRNKRTELAAKSLWKTRTAITDAQSNKTAPTPTAKPFSRNPPAASSTTPPPSESSRTNPATPTEDLDPFADAPREVDLSPETLAGYRNTVGWAERGGKLLRDASGQVTGRTKWLPRDPWWAAYKASGSGTLSEAQAKAALQAAIDGQPLTAKQQALLTFLADYDAVARQRDAESQWIEDQLSTEEQALLDRLETALAEHPAFGRDRLAEFLERIAQKYEALTPAQFGRALIKTYEAKLHELQQAESIGRTEVSAEGAASPAGEGAGLAPGETPLLTDYTLAELDAENARVQAELEKQRQADAAAEAKRQADKAVDGFTLTGSNRPADVAAARGQKNLLDIMDGKAVNDSTTQKETTPAARPPLSATATADHLRQARKDGQIDTPALIQGLAQRVVRGEIPIGKLFGNLQAFDDWSEGDVAMALREAGMAPAQLKALGYEQKFAAASSPAAVTDALQALAGNALVQDLLKAGTLRVVARQAQLPASIVIPAGQRVAGAVDPDTGVVYLIAENIAPDEIAGFLTHEVGVHQAQLGLNQPKSRALRLAHALTRLVGARQMLGEPAFNDALTQLQRLRATSKPVQAAYAAAEKAMGKLNQNPALLHEEALAYLVQNHPQTSLAQKIIAAVRAFLYRAGLRINLTENDLQALAVSALRGRARGKTRPGTISKGVRGQNAQDAEAQRQYDAVVARYTLPDGTKAPGWMKAPNGEPTKLNERQWVQVRTENFKQWFGDWEFAAHQQAIDELQTVPIDFMLDNTLPLAEARHQALAETKRKFSLDQQPKIVTAPNGDEIQIAMAGLKESISKHAGLQKMRILPVLDRLIENSHFVLAAPDAKADQRKTPNILGYRYYVAKAKLDGKSYYVKLAVREIEDGGIKRKFYDHDLSEVSEVIREQGTAHLAAAGNPTAMTSLDHIVRHGWQKFNGDTSQVIDANGEPLVVYHQTTVDITEFVPGGEPVKQYGEQVHLRGSKAGKFNYYGIEGMVSGPGIWFADNPNETNAGPQANVISATSNPNLIPGFMALKNPLLITSNEQRMALRDRYKPDPHNLPVDSKVKDHNGRTWFVKHTDLDFPFRFDQRQKKQLIQDGHDGIVLAISGWAREYIAFSPTQIKSALGNTGAFSPDNADIRYAYALGQAEPNLTAEEVLQRIESGGEVTAEEFALLQAYLSGASRTLTATGVDAPSFKEWFGTSKIKGKAGQPLKMYHGTATDFTVFDAQKAGGSTKHPTAALGFFFTNNRAHAAEKYGDRVMEVYLSLEKPYLMTDADLRRIDTLEEALAFRKRLEQQGYDGIVMPAETKTRYVVAFRPDQIKRTTNETYTRGDPDMRFALAPPRTGQAPGLFEKAPVAVTQLTGQEFGENLNKLALAKAADALLRTLQTGSPLTNNDTGWNLVIGKQDRRKMGDNADMTPVDSKAVAGLVDLVRYAVLAESHPDQAHQNPEVSAIHRLYAPVQIGNRLYRVKLTVKDYATAYGRRNLHALESVEIENALPGTLPAPSSITSQQAQPTTGRTTSIAHLLAGAIRDSDGQPFAPAPSQRFAAANPRPLTPEQQAAMNKIGRRAPQGWGVRFAGLRERIGLKLRQAIADHHAALLDLDRQAYGAGVVENQTAAASWVKARLSRSVDGPMHLLLHETGLRLDADGALDVLPTVKGLQKVLEPNSLHSNWWT